MKIAVIPAAVLLSGSFLGLLALDDNDGESPCRLCCAAEKKVSETSPESKGTDVNQVAQAADTLDETGYSCLLSPAELEQRRSATNAEIIAKADDIVETDDGYKLKFSEADDQLVATLAEWINVERKCCNFLRFELVFEQFTGPIWLEVGGDAAAKQFLKRVMKR